MRITALNGPIRGDTAMFVRCCRQADGQDKPWAIACRSHNDERVLPIPRQPAAQRQAISFGVNGELLLQNFQDVGLEAKAVFAFGSFSKNICCGKQSASGNVLVDGLRQG
jgi:hypothetical protein